eukprot:CAMPEP_0179202668 /NCGR_PEP_ID=MMETSP0796-20121207/100962_1 /TAXON_ID=73915 /ORGANISM="Pyrodinium bahamense, Strain pbaha01" /LENGTH=41 /DNA_ID= /DNA_START= /DNA_END= /DNA_ORIENTATION=
MPAQVLGSSARVPHVSAQLSWLGIKSGLMTFIGKSSEPASL